MEYCIYILFSETKNRYYIGFSSNIDSRITRHNQKGKGFTGSVNDWKLVHTEYFLTKEEARKRELQIKSWKGRIKIKELIVKND